MMKVLGPLLFASLAAVGNAMFAAGQKKAAGLENTLAFMGLTVALCFLMMTAAAPLFGPTGYVDALRGNWHWILLSAAGLFLTYLGFNLLYVRYGATSYGLYAALSVISTSIVVGAVIFRESMNLYHWLALAAAVLTVVLFSAGNRIGQG